ncbi:MAG: hypothetical protein KGZ83_15720 [Sulfuricella sp.]|nr:hypothetical protein [Sulfuricella sp.]
MQFIKLLALILIFSGFSLRLAEAQTISDGMGGTGSMTVSATGNKDEYAADIVYSNYRLPGTTYTVNGTVHTTVQVSFPTLTTVHLNSGAGRMDLKYVMQDSRYPGGSVEISATSDVTVSNGMVHAPINWATNGKVYATTNYDLSERDYMHLFYGMKL